jgi:hypothetical protein
VDIWQSAYFASYAGVLLAMYIYIYRPYCAIDRKKRRQVERPNSWDLPSDGRPTPDDRSSRHASPHAHTHTRTHTGANCVCAPTVQDDNAQTMLPPPLRLPWATTTTAPLVHCAMEPQTLGGGMAVNVLVHFSLHTRVSPTCR